MLQETAKRAMAFANRAIVVADAALRGQILEQLDQIGCETRLFIGEPIGRNTAPAIAAAALAASTGEIMVVLPSDHVIADTTRFVATVQAAAELAGDGALVTFGIVPTRAETGYGYIETGDPIGAGRKVVRFVEKPDDVTAREYVDSGLYLWNSGMFVFDRDVILAELEEHQPGLVALVRDAMQDGGTLGPEFGDAPSLSIDYAVMEKTQRAVVVPLDAGWDDLGSWAALWELGSKDGDGNVTVGEVILEDVTGSYVRADSRLVAVIGVSDVVVVETDDAVLVVPRNRTQEVKSVVDRLRES